MSALRDTGWIWIHHRGGRVTMSKRDGWQRAFGGSGRRMDRILGWPGDRVWRRPRFTLRRK
jgi:hypothetical protein